MPITVDFAEFQRWVTAVRDDACRLIAEQGGTALLNDLVTSVHFVNPQTGGIERALFNRTPAYQDADGWNVGVGDLNQVGDNPTDPAPTGTIADFLKDLRT